MPKKKKKAKSFRKDALLEVVKAVPGRNAAQLAALFGLKRSGMQETLTAMLEAGLVVRRYKERPASAAKKGRGQWLYYSKDE